MNPEKSSTTTKLCPTCGTRIALDAARCVVCGSELAAETKAKKGVQGTRMPEFTLSLPIALGFLMLFLAIGATLLFIILRTTGRVVSPTPGPSPTTSPTTSLIPTASIIPTETATLTPLPPVEYIVQAGDTCNGIAALFNVSTTVIIQENHLNANCTNLAIGQTLYVPQPTATPLPAPTATLESAAATRAACQTVSYTVQANDTLGSIAANYTVSISAIKEWNGLSTDAAILGQELVIPLCMRAATPGPSPTSSPPPPYPAPNLLLPVDGNPFTLANDSITLQWSSVGILNDNEAYQIAIEDVTAGTGTKLVQVIDTTFIVPVTFRPQDNVPCYALVGCDGKADWNGRTRQSHLDQRWFIQHEARLYMERRSTACYPHKMIVNGYRPKSIHWAD